MGKIKANNGIKKLNHLGYGLLLIATYFVQTTPFMIKINNSYPNVILILLILVAMFESNTYGAIFGLFAGMLVDINAVNGSGLHAITYMLTGFICSLLIGRFLQNNIISLLTIGAITLLIHSVIELLTKSTLTSRFIKLYFNSYFNSVIYSFFVLILSYYIFAFSFGFKLFYKKPTGIYSKQLKKKRT